jgi:hypothetical protein
LQLKLSIGLDALCRAGFCKRRSSGVVVARATSLDNFSVSQMPHDLFYVMFKAC